MRSSKSVRSIDVRDVYHQEYFLQRVDGYDQFDAFDGTSAALFDRARRNYELLKIQAGETFLDLGCGRGEVTIAAATAGATAVGCDFSQDAIILAGRKAREIAQKRGQPLRCSFLCGVATDDLFSPNSFDKILMSEFAEHVAPEEFAVILRNTYRWLKPGGRLLVFTYPNRWTRRVHPFLRIYVRLTQGVDMGRRPEDTLHPDYQKLHLNEQSYISLRRAFLHAGFRRVRVWFDQPADSGRFSLIKRTLLYRMLFHSNLTALGTK